MNTRNIQRSILQVQNLAGQSSKIYSFPLVLNVLVIVIPKLLCLALEVGVHYGLLSDVLRLSMISFLCALSHELLVVKHRYLVFSHEILDGLILRSKFELNKVLVGSLGDDRSHSVVSLLLLVRTFTRRLELWSIVYSLFISPTYFSFSF